MKKQTLLLMVAGNLCIGFRLIARPFMKPSESLVDFLLGFGVMLLIGALWISRKAN